MSEYQSWLRAQEVRCFELQESVKDFNLKGKPIITGSEPPIFRLITDGKFIDFRVREIKTSMVKYIWVSRVDSVVPNVHWIIISKREGDILYILSDQLTKKGERRQSDFKRDQYWYVAERGLCKNFSVFLRRQQKQIEKDKQKVLTKWFA